MIHNALCVLAALIVSNVLLHDALAAAPDSASYTYYQNGRLKSVIYQNGTVITYYYNQAGNRTSVLTANICRACSSTPQDNL
jgi:YD repeat-containing protein